MENLPWLEYSGQATAELLACKNTHRTDSLLCAFELGVQAKLDQKGEDTLTEAEQLLLAVSALEREVNNGGYHQFFTNSSGQFAPIIVDSLLRIQCTTIADITARAIAALDPRELSAEALYEAACTEDPERDEILDACDNEYYQLVEIEPNLFNFVEAHQHEIQLAAPPAAPPKI
jgi:hypothetical protein